jgi:Transcriptional regulators
MARKSNKNANIKDVAALAGVSIATVSRFLNGNLGRMSAATATKVQTPSPS